MSTSKKAPRPAKVKKVTKKELHLKAVRAQAVLDHIAADVRAKHGTMRDFARQLVRKELAAWLMKVRAQAAELDTEIRRVCEACREPGGLMEGIIEDGALAHLNETRRNVDSASACLSAIQIECPRSDVLEYAKGFREGWNV